MKLEWSNFEKYMGVILEQFSFLDPDIKSKAKMDFNKRILYFNLPSSVVRVVSDRKQLFIDIGEGDGQWFDLGYVALTKNPTLDFSYHYIETEEELTKEMKCLAELMRKYGLELVRGDFSIQAAYKETARRRWQELEGKYKK